MAKINIEGVKERFANAVRFTGKCCAVVGPILAAALLNKASESFNDLCVGTKVYEYGDAVSTIVKSDMMTSGRNRAIAALKKDGTSEYYKAVVAIVNSDMMTSGRVSAIEEISK